MQWIGEMEDLRSRLQPSERAREERTQNPDPRLQTHD